MAEALAELLGSWGLTVEQANTLGQRVAALDEATRAAKPHDLLLVDRYLGRNEGLELACLARGPEGTRPVVLLLPVSEMAAEAANCRRHGFACLAKKPWRALDLRGAVLTALGLAPAQEQALPAAGLQAPTKAPARPPLQVLPSWPRTIWSTNTWPAKC